MLLAGIILFGCASGLLLWWFEELERRDDLKSWQPVKGGPMYLWKENKDE